MRVHGDKVIRRRTAIDKRTNYRKYLPELREDFQYICGYCGKPESITKNAFEIDHFVPRKYDKSRENDYTNLVYSCCVCNRKKSSKWPSEDGKIQFLDEKGFVDPAVEEYDKHMERREDIWKNQKGTIYGRSIGVLVETAKRSLAVHAANGKKEVTQRKNADAFSR